jgi:arylsulfatase A-like enzyme
MPGSHCDERRRATALLAAGAILVAGLAEGCRSDHGPAVARERLTPFSEARVAAVRLGQVSRPGVTTAPGESLRKTVDVAPGSRLDLAMALVCPPDQPCRGSGRFTVRADHGARRATLLTRELAVDGTSSLWQEVAIALDPSWEGPVDLTLSFEASSSRTAGGPSAVWGEPFLSHGQPAARPNVLLISIDTLRADHLGSYGYRHPTSPNLDALAKGAVRFARAYAQSPWTTPSHMSLLTGLYPSGHGVNQSFTQLAQFLDGQGRYRLLSPRLPTLAEILRRAGYRTLALTGGVGVDSTLGFDRGFDIYENDAELTPEALSRVTGWWDAYRGAPWFLFFHTYEVHAPYWRTELATRVLSAEERKGLEELRARTAARDASAFLKHDSASRKFFRHLRSRGLMRREVTEALYDGGILSMDRFLGRLLEELGRRGLDQRTIVVVTSDHGEEFADHDPERFYDAHCTPMFDELLHVPLIVRVPDHEPRTVAASVESVDVAPTLIQLLGLPIPPTMQGKSLVAAMGGAAVRPDRTLSEATCSGPEMKAFREGRYKLIVSSEAEDGERTGLGPIAGRLLFDLATDPGERRSIHEREAARVREIEGHLVALLGRVTTSAEAGFASSPGREVSDALKERLRALGYIE